MSKLISAPVYKPEKIEIRLLRDELELEKFQRLVYEEYCVKRDWLDPSIFEDKIVVDEYDKISTSIALMFDGELVGGFRLVPGVNNTFPHEKQSSTSLPLMPLCGDNELQKEVSEIGRSGIMEITRAVCKKNSKYVFAVDLYKALYWYGQLQKKQGYFMVIDMKFFLHCCRIGAPLTPVGVPVYCEGSWTLPCITTFSRLVSTTSFFDKKYRSYICNPNNIVGFND